MMFRIIRKEQQKESSWSGGKTYELAIFPSGAEYLDRDFFWRLSTACSDREESSFTKLPDYDRILMVLEGDVVLAHGEQRSAHLQALEQDQFDGAVKTRCFGKLIRDYNLIYAKGCGARMELMELRPAARPVPMGSEAPDHMTSYGIFCLEGYAVVACGENSEMIREGEQCVVDFPDGVTDDILLMGEGRCILTEIVMGERKPADQENPADNPSEDPASFTKDATDAKGSDGVYDAAPPRQKAGGAAGAADAGAFSDYKACLKLFFSRNRWSLIMRREGRSKMYYDRALIEALRKVERKYITLIIYIAGLMICAVPAFKYGGVKIGGAVLILFTLVHLFVIAPCVYMKLLPRPLSAHMKRVEQMNAAERAYHEKEVSEDPHFDRLMQKYESDEENYFTDESSPLHRLVKRK